ncbi:MFS transporter [Candidatus Lucifugimonas marina]|uniref:MFS transporter n=1 Tax=Candidatus Lucifugimonas marina TaxID=3038979 RepID=A0AAJ6CTI6_9CHLR|nr:MFS transporter [SAR202 cluster bacterium JH702]MDG0869070.1 MFS transporter [SAR202 cluster bacterium JH639]WFG35691.1 MFS transporter [SAR202 cluster bacterium JH545]WFG39637.1 MFS transporter [SAR202 cluster bacterium JH1073]
MTNQENSSTAPTAQQVDLDAYKWKAFTAIGIAFFTMVASMGMVFIALTQIAATFNVTLRDASWVVIAQGLTISAFMMPMGRMADIIGRKKVHLIGLVLFASGSVFTAFAPTFALLIAARVFTAIGNSMGQSVGTAMVLSVFPAHERGKAIGAQTTSVAVGGAMGPVIAGLVLQFLPWQALFLMLTIPIGIAFIAGYFILDEKIVSLQRRGGGKQAFDWVGAIVSGLMITVVVILINNPFGVAIVSPLILGGITSAVILFAFFVWWELKSDSPMLELRMFKNLVFSMAVTTRFLGFLGTTAVRFLMPIYLISLRDIQEAAAGAIIFITSLGMAAAASTSGRMGDRLGERPFTVVGFAMLVATAIAFMVFTAETPLWIVMFVLLINGLAMGLWGVPNNSTILGSVPKESFGVVGALTNLTRNVGNVAGQAIASAVVVGVMVSDGFDIPLNKITGNAPASASFMDGWKYAYALVTVFSLIGLALAILTKPKSPEQVD